jgi:hypothetical protein
VLSFWTSVLALGAVMAVLEVLMVLYTIALTIYASLALIGVVVFSVIGIRHRIARRRGLADRTETPKPVQPHVPSDRAGEFR